MRRKELEVTDKNKIIEILGKCEYLNLGLCDGDKPYVVPMNFGFVYQQQLEIYLHCAAQGRKMDIIAKNPNVCFSAEHGHKIVPSENAGAWTAHFESIVGEGTIAVVENKEEKVKGLDALMANCGYLGKPEYSEKALTAVTVLKITVDSFTGKRKPAKG